MISNLNWCKLSFFRNYPILHFLIIIVNKLDLLETLYLDFISSFVNIFRFRISLEKIIINK